jgi:DNA-binding NarL/FixJ family response regulator
MIADVVDPVQTSKHAEAHAAAGAAPVAVVDSVPIFRRSLAFACANAGVQALEFDTLASVSTIEVPAAVVASLRSEQDWDHFAAYAADGCTQPLIVVIPNSSPPIIELAISLGASAFIDGAASPDDAVETIHAALGQKTLMPSDVLHELVTRRGDEALLAPSELEWLKRLASGMTVADLAEHAGYSQRQMFRQLSKLYARLGVRGRREALAYAERAGLLK